MNRYLKSFLITFTLYATIIGFLFLFSSSFKKPSIKTQKVVNIKIINYQPVKKTQNLTPKKVEEIPKKEPIKEDIKPNKTKPIKKEIKHIKKEKKFVKKTPIKKPKKIAKKTHKKIKNTKKVAKKRVKKHQKRAKVKSNNNSSISNVSTKPSKYKNYNFLSNLIKRINQNKSYPRLALRRGLSGEVTVYFTILPNGSVGNIRVIGSKIFENAAIKAVKNSFPIDVSGAPFSLPKNVSLNMRFILR